MAKNSGFDLGGGAAIGSADSMEGLGVMIDRMLEDETLDPVAREEIKVQAEAELRKIKDLKEQIKRHAAQRVDRRAKATVEALLISAGMTGHFCDIEILGVDAFELVVDEDFETTLGELSLIGRIFQTTAIEVDRGWRSSEKAPEAVREFCSLCSDYHEVERPYWSGDRVVITVRGIGIDLQSPLA